MPREAPGAFNQALMDLGAGICLPGGGPLCDTCPAADFCAAREQGRQRELPVRAPKKEKRLEEKTVFLLLGLGGRYKKAELPEERIFQRTILSNAEDVMDVCRELEAFCEVWGADMKQQMFSTMTVEELGMAILKHGFQGRTDGYLQLTAIMDESGVLELHLRDDATTFNPFALDTSRASRDEDFDMDGMGVLVIKKRAKEFFYRRYQGFNTLIIKI